VAKFFDVIEVSLQPPHKVKRMAAWKIEQTAQGLIALFTQRLGDDSKTFLMVPSLSYTTGDSYKEPLSMPPTLDIFTDRLTGMKCGTLRSETPPADLIEFATEHDLDRLAVVNASGQVIARHNGTTLRPRHFV
jgi:hypothetical protein